MKWQSFGRVMLLTLLSIGEIGRAQTKSNIAPPAPQSSAKNPFDSFKTFSATLNGGIGRDHDRKILRSGNLMRMEFDGFYRLTDLEKGITFGVDARSCTQFSAPDAASYPFSAYRDHRVERRLTTEKETIDGHACIIEDVSFAPREGPFVIKMRLWEAEDLQHFPIKIAVESVGPGGKAGSKMEILYTNVIFDTPAPGLFKRPDDCEPDSPLAAPKPRSKPTVSQKSPR